MIVDCLAIKQAVSEVSGFKIADLEGMDTMRRLSFERQKAIYLCSKHTRMEVHEIGSHFGSRQTQTVVKAISTLEGKMRGNHRLQDDLDELLARANEIYADWLVDPINSVSQTIVNGVVERITALMAASNSDLATLPSSARLQTSITNVLAAKREFETERYSTGERYAFRRLMLALGDLGPAFSDWSATLSQHENGETP